MVLTTTMLADKCEVSKRARSSKPPNAIGKDINYEKDDESLRKYKEILLGESTAGAAVVDPSSDNRVLVRKLALVVEGRDDNVLDLTGDISSLKDQSFTIKEGISYKIRIDFHVQREIVTGLKYIQRTYRKGIQVDKMSHMVGSYAPKMEVQSYTTPVEDAPSGMIARGHYNVKSLFTDDDNNEHLKWEWSFDIKKDWN
ncbi:unnamed protein product, partial [Meganyctiphanes norvegica]